MHRSTLVRAAMGAMALLLLRTVSLAYDLPAATKQLLDGDNRLQAMVLGGRLLALSGAPLDTRGGESRDVFVDNFVAAR